jgi:hypothetical protein
MLPSLVHIFDKNKDLLSSRLHHFMHLCFSLSLPLALSLEKKNETCLEEATGVRSPEKTDFDSSEEFDSELFSSFLLLFYDDSRCARQDESFEPQ